MTDLDYITSCWQHRRWCPGTEGARVQPDEPQRAAHDALNRLLNWLEPDTALLWSTDSMARSFAARWQGRNPSDWREAQAFDEQVARQIG